MLVSYCLESPHSSHHHHWGLTLLGAPDYLAGVLCLGLGAVCPNVCGCPWRGSGDFLGGPGDQKVMSWPVACRANEPLASWRGNGSVTLEGFGLHDLGEFWAPEP